MEYTLRTISTIGIPNFETKEIFSNDERAREWAARVVRNFGPQTWLMGMRLSTDEKLLCVYRCDVNIVETTCN